MPCRPRIRRLDGPDAQSTRLRLQRECIVQTNAQREATRLPAPGCDCIRVPAPPLQEPTARDQLSFTLDQAVRCALRYVTPSDTIGCQPLYTDPIPPLTDADVPPDQRPVEPPQGPAVATVYRKYQRIGGIEEISRPLVGRAGSDRTRLLRESIISQSQTRYVNTVLPIVPYPQCIPPRRGVQAGVPIAVSTPCNLGARRVDFSNPTA